MRLLDFIDDNLAHLRGLMFLSLYVPLLSNLPAVWDVFIYGINAMECPELPFVTDEERELYEVSFACALLSGMR